MDKMKMLAAKAALNRCLSDSSFSICAVRYACELLEVGGFRDKDSYKILNTIHCVNYSKIDRELRDQIPALIADVLGFDIDAKSNDEIVVSESKGGAAKMLLRIIGQ